VGLRVSLETEEGENLSRQPEIKLQFLGPPAHIVVSIVITLSQ